MNITLKKAEIQPCCANCWFNNWEEDGPSCVHPAQWDDDEFEIDDEDGHVTYIGEEQTYSGVIDWDNVCEHHHPGTFAQLERSDIAYLEVLAGAKGRPMGERAISASLHSMQREEIADEIEPFLLDKKYVEITARGREITWQGKDFLAKVRELVK